MESSPNCCVDFYTLTKADNCNVFWWGSGIAYVSLEICIFLNDTKSRMMILNLLHITPQHCGETGGFFFFSIFVFVYIMMQLQYM